MKMWLVCNLVNTHTEEDGTRRGTECIGLYLWQDSSCMLFNLLVILVNC